MPSNSAWGTRGTGTTSTLAVTAFKNAGLQLLIVNLAAETTSIPLA